MKIKFNIEKITNIVPYLIYGSITMGIIGGAFGYYLPDNFNDKVKQISDTDIDLDNVETSELGDMYYLFDVGEHKVVMSRNDMWYRKIEKVAGYEISEVEVNGWRDNSKVTFVNKVPVKAKVTASKDGQLKCDEFGIVTEEEKVKSK